MAGVVRLVELNPGTLGRLQQRHLVPVAPIGIVASHHGVHQLLAVLLEVGLEDQEEGVAAAQQLMVGESAHVVRIVVSVEHVGVVGEEAARDVRPVARGVHVEDLEHDLGGGRAGAVAGHRAAEGDVGAVAEDAELGPREVRIGGVVAAVEDGGLVDPLARRACCGCGCGCRCQRRRGRGGGRRSGRGCRGGGGRRRGGRGVGRPGLVPVAHDQGQVDVIRQVRDGCLNIDDVPDAIGVGVLQALLDIAQRDRRVAQVVDGVAGVGDLGHGTMMVVTTIICHIRLLGLM